MRNHPIPRSLLTLSGLLFLWTGLSATLYAQPAALIEHRPVNRAQRGEAVVLEARLINASAAPLYVRLYYRQPGQTAYEYLDMLPAGDGYRLTLPRELLERGRLEYFITALLADRQIITHPLLNPYGQPHQMEIIGEAAATEEAPAAPAPPIPVPKRPSQQVPQPAEEQVRRPPTERTAGVSTEVEILILSPEPGTAVLPDEAVIAASFLSETSGIDTNSVQILLDGEDVTNEAEVSEFLLSYTPIAIGPGRHEVRLKARDLEGRPVEASWRFRVRSVRQPKRGVRAAGPEFSFNGRAFASLREEKVSGQKLTTNRFGTNFSGRYGKLTFGGQVLLTSVESKFSQPRNRFTFRFGLPWLQFVLGDSYPRMNDLILWGKRVRGLQGGLHLGFFNVDVAFGQTRRAIVFNDSRAPVFEQDLFAIRPSFGSGRHFQLGFTLMRVRDDRNSISGGTNPKDNVAFGPDLLIAIDNRRIELRASAAISFLTNDISGGALSKDSVAANFDVDLPFDPQDYEKYFILNESTVPLDPRDGTSVAWQAALILRYFRNQFEFGYRRLGPEYLSLGQSFLRNDLRGWYVRDRIGLLQNRLFVNFGYENYDDSFTQKEGNPKLDLKTASFGLSIYPGPSLPTITFSVRNHDRNNGISEFDPDVDSFDQRESNVSRDVSFMVNYDAFVLNARNTITLNIMSSNRNDRFAGQRVGGLKLNNVDSDLRSVTVRTKYNGPFVSTLSFATNQNSAAGGLSNFEFRIYSGQLDYLLLDERLRLYGGLRLTSADGLVKSTQADVGTQVTIDFTQTAYRFGGQFQISPKQVLMLDVELLSFRDNGFTLDLATGTTTPNPNYNDRRVRAYYEVRL